MKSILLGMTALMLFAGSCAAAPHSNAQLIARFYAAFNAHDAKTMAACYSPDVSFSDAVFPDLKGKQAVGMWRMLCANGKDLRVEASQIEADDTHGKAHWEAWYTFGGPNGRKVHNVIEARFDFKAGLITNHVDTYNFWTWSRQALGTAGSLLGWTHFLQAKVRRTAAKQLAEYLKQNPE
jgi:hypothetical protein